MRMSLFEIADEKPESAVWAARYAPQSLEEFFGQRHLLGEGGVIRQAIAQGTMMNAIFRGVPGVGKTTLGKLIAAQLDYHYHYLNATKTSVQEIRDIAKIAQQRRTMSHKSTLIFLDEIHRFATNQQDILLPCIETGEIVLIGATTENPHYALNNALLSRCLTFEFLPLSVDEIVELYSHIAKQAHVALGDGDYRILANLAHGDARKALMLLQSYAMVAQTMTLAEFTQQLDLHTPYDATQDKYNMISAMIKSIRGSDTDAAIYRLACLLEGGEDPRYIARRLVILASEDVGLADNHALVLATAAMTASERLGMPEIRIPLGHVVIYLSQAPKSNSAYKAINQALDLVRSQGASRVPHHLTAQGKDSYLYPHDYPEHRVEQSYRDDTTIFYEPSGQGTDTTSSLL